MTRTGARKGNGWQFDYYRPSFKEWIKIVFGWPIFTADGDMVDWCGQAQKRGPIMLKKIPHWVGVTMVLVTIVSGGLVFKAYPDPAFKIVVVLLAIYSYSRLVKYPVATHIRHSGGLT